MKVTKSIHVEYDNIDIEYARKIEDAIDHFSELCREDYVKCEKSCPFYSLCGEQSNGILSRFAKYAENNVE